MSYKYCVPWCTKAKSYLEGYKRDVLWHCKMFHKYEKALKFADSYTPKLKIYVLEGEW